MQFLGFFSSLEWLYVNLQSFRDDLFLHQKSVLSYPDLQVFLRPKVTNIKL